MLHLQPVPRTTAPIAISVVLHAFFGVGLWLAPAIKPPLQITYEFDVVKNKDFLPPEAPDEPPLPPPRRRPKPKPAGEGPGDGGVPDGGVPDGGPTDGGPTDGPADGGAPDAAPRPVATKDLRKYAPGGARVIVLLRNDLVRRSPYRAAAEGLLRALPDWRSLVGDSDFDPIGELDAMLVATPNPYDVTATFLAARVKNESRARAAIHPQVGPNDPRTLDWPVEHLAVFASKEQHEKIAGPWLRHLQRFENQTSGGAALYLTLQDLKGLMEVTGGRIIRIPRTCELSVTVTEPASLRLKNTYEDEDTAQKVLEAWPWIVDKVKHYAPVQIFGLATLPDSLTPRREGTILYVEGTVARRHIEALLTLARMALLRQL